MYRLPKEVFDTLLNNSIDPLTGERVIGYLCGKRQEMDDVMSYVLQHFLPGERPDEPEEAYWLYKIEEFFPEDENEIVFQPEDEDDEFVADENPAPGKIPTVIISSLEELLKREPGLNRYMNHKGFALFKRLV